MDNCGCAPGSLVTNQSDNLSGNGLSLNNTPLPPTMNVNNNNLNNNVNNNLNNSVNVNNNANNNTSVDLNALLGVNNNSNGYDRPISPGSISHAEQTREEILQSIAKNNIDQLNQIEEPKKLGEKVAQTAKETLALSKKHILLATVFTMALAWNDAIKFFIGRNIKINRGSSFYYLYYALSVTLLAVVLHHLLS